MDEPELLLDANDPAFERKEVSRRLSRGVPPLRRSGFEDAPSIEALNALDRLRRLQLPTLTPLLPLLLHWKGKPLRLRNHPQFEPLFDANQPNTLVLMCARQLGKSTGLAASGVLQSASLSHHASLFVTPLFEMTRRFSHNYVKPMIEESPVRHLLIDLDKKSGSVLQRNFRNGSSQHFNYAFYDAERTRGIPADSLIVDESQDIVYDVLPVLYETLSGSPYATRRHAGTPKTPENTLSLLWEDSSQAEWVTRCETMGCRHLNIPSKDYDLYDMIGPWHRGISEKCPGVVCAKCRKPLNPRAGRWWHRYPDRRWKCMGLRLPQIVSPVHYANAEKWDRLRGKQAGQNGMTPQRFLNEVCAEVADTGSSILSVADLKAAACLPWTNKLDEAAKRAKEYTHLFLAVDWGGGGGRVPGTGKSRSGEEYEPRERVSFTSLAVVGSNGDGRVDVLWGHRSTRTHEWEYEAQICAEVFRRLRCTHLVHDYNGAGVGRLVLLRQGGLPVDRVVNTRYSGPQKSAMALHMPTESHPYAWYSIDKNWSLATLCLCVRHGLVRFFEYDHQGADRPGLLHDFLSLNEEKMSRRLGPDVFAMTSDPRKSDDFAQAVNIGCCFAWWETKVWPDLAGAAKFKLPKGAIRRAIAPDDQLWDEL